MQLKADLFADARIRKLKRATNGYIMLVIYLRLLTLALNDEGYIIYDTHFENLSEQLSFALNDENESDIEATVAYCVALGLVQIIGPKQKLYFTDFGALTTNYKQLPRLNRNTEKLKKEKKKPSPAAIRQRRYRERKKLKEKLLQEAKINERA